MSDQYIKFMDKHFKDWAYITSKRCFINIKTGITINKEAFSDLLGHNDFPLKMVTSKDGVISMVIAKTAADSFNKNQFKRYIKVFKTTIDSDHKCGHVVSNIDGVEMVNVWSGTSIKPVNNDNDAVELFIDLVNKLLPGGDVDNIINWMAHVIQNPTKKVLWSPILVGTKGNGKTTMATVISKIVGDRYSKVVDKETLSDKFNGWISDKCYAVVEEIKVGSDFNIIDKIKKYVTNSTLPMRAMKTDSADETNHCDFMICSNHIDALKIENDERRWYPVITNQRPGDETAVEKTFGKNKGAAYFKRFYAEVVNNKSGLESICHYLDNIDLSDFNSGTAPDSVHKAEFVSATMCNSAKLLQEAIEDNCLDVGGLLLKKSIDDVGRDYRIKIPTTRAFSNAIDELGYFPLDGRVNVSGNNIKSTLYAHKTSKYDKSQRTEAWAKYKSERSSSNTYHYAMNVGSVEERVLKVVKK